MFFNAEEPFFAKDLEMVYKVIIPNIADCLFIQKIFTEM